MRGKKVKWETFDMPQNAVFAQALDFAGAQCRKVLAKYPNYHPMYTVAGQWKKEGELWTHWCEGFYPGIYWLLFQHTQDSFWRQHAEAASKRLEPRRWDRKVHDLGFLFFSTYLRWYQVAGDPAHKHILIDAGRTLAMRRQIGGYLASFIGPESLFIDIMMNVGIILWAARETDDETLRQIAIEHCRTTQKYLVRADGGTAHEGIFDVTTGAFQRESTHQGYAPNSTWTRGLAWAIYGFAAAHRLSGLTEFRDTAQRCADCYLRRASEHLVPPWDFDAPSGDVMQYDSSAAAITAAGLFDLVEQVDDPKLKERYRNAALTMLETLCSEQFLANKTPGWEGILKRGVYHIHKGLGVDESVAWGDHFFVEALVKALA
jgi:unsaturated chondroitin disaccharide hydrolase